MFNRRYVVSVIACLAVLMSMPSAFAGGGGTKKDSTVKVMNSGTNTIYAFVDASDADITTASMASDPIAAFNAMGGKQIAAGGASRTFSVPARCDGRVRMFRRTAPRSVCDCG